MTSFLIVWTCISIFANGRGSLPIVLCHPSWSAQLNFWVLGPEAKGDGDGTFACMVENGYFCVLTNCNSTISIR